MSSGFGTRLFGVLLRQSDREMVLGDLVEERALRASAGSEKAASQWYRRQMIRSIPPVLWANLRRGLWLKTMGAALLAYLIAALLIMASDVALTMMRLHPAIYPFVSLAAGFLTMALAGYVASRMRRGAPMVLATIAGVMGIMSLASPGPHGPLWYECSLIVVGPAAALAGARIRLRGKERS